MVIEKLRPNQLLEQELKQEYRNLPVIVKNYLFLGELILREETTSEAKQVFNDYRLSILNEMMPLEKNAMIDFVTKRDRMMFAKVRKHLNRIKK